MDNENKYRYLLFSYKYLVLATNKIKHRFPVYGQCLTLLKDFRDVLLEKIDISILDNFLVEYNLSIEPEDDAAMYALHAIEHYNTFVLGLKQNTQRDLIIFGSNFLKDISHYFSLQYDLPYWVVNKPKW